MKTLKLNSTRTINTKSTTNTTSTSSKRKPIRSSGNKAPARPRSKPVANTTPERLDIQKIYVYRLPPSGLAYQLSLAAHLLVAVGEGYSLQQLFAEVKIDEGARANVQRLTFDALRHWGTTQFWINHAISNPPAEWIQAVLSVALTQLLLEEESEFTLVNEAVLAIDNNKPHAKGMVNAILRRFLREREEWINLAKTNEVAQYNHPQWWIDTLKTQYPNEWQNILTVNNSHPPMSLRVNAQKYSTHDYQALLAQHGHNAYPSELCAQALILETPCPVSELPEFAAGAVSVQDVGAQLSATLLDVQSGHRVLDACAAPGGKTSHLLERHPDTALTALEKDGARAQRIHENLDRLHLDAQVIITDANDTHQWWDGIPYERILLDAPCSASGIVRRHPDIRWLRQADDLVGLAQQQARLLRAMWQVLATGGRLLFCSCSVFTTEGATVIDAFLQHTPNARLVPILGAQQASTAGMAREGMVQLLPHAEQTRNHDGFFYALLEKTA